MENIYMDQYLENQLNRIRILKDKGDWKKSITQCESVIYKIRHSHPPAKDEYRLYLYLGESCFRQKKYSASIDAYYKAYTIALKHHFKPAEFAYLAAQLGNNFLAIRNIDQAMQQFVQVERYYRQFGYAVPFMPESNYVTTLICMAYCYLYKNDLPKVQEILEKELANFQDLLAQGISAVDYSHLKGEYCVAVKDYKRARLYFNECMNISVKINARQETLEAKVHIAVLDMMENNLKSAAAAFDGIYKEAGRMKLDYMICESALLLSRCYTLENRHEDAEKIEQKIKPILGKLDIVWLYEKNREFEQLFRQLRISQEQTVRPPSGVPEVLADSISRHYKDSFFYDIVIGKSEKMHNVCQLLEKIAPTDLPVLIQGETGTGKELSARAIHQNSTRSKNTWLAFNCGAIQETLLESELFGHEKGAFTGASSEKKGYMEIASEGTVFLDEIADMSPALQKKLLRVLEEKKVWRVGAEKPVSVNTRFVFASNQDIEELVKKKLFREDLFYRVNTITVNLPSLRERKEDILWLAAHFLKKCAAAGESRIIVPEAGSLLINYHWPGNVRELENEMKRICVLHKGAKRVEPHMLSENIRNYVPKPGNAQTGNGLTLKQIRDEFEKKVISGMLKECNGNICVAARRFGCDSSGLYKKIKHYGLDVEENL